MTTTVVNINHAWDFDVYVGRPGHGEPGPFGNPFRIGRDGITSREEAIARFREWFLARVESDLTFREAVLNLRGKTLGCFCLPAACHATVIAEWIDAQPLDALDRLRNLQPLTF